MSKKKGPFSKAWKEVKKVKRETFRIIDQGLDLGDKGIKILGVDKILGGGGSIGISTSSGRGGGHNVHFTPSNRSVSVGIGISNNGTPSLFVDNQAALPLTAPPPGTRWKGNDIARQDMLELLSQNLNSEIYYDFWEADLNKGPRYGK